MSEPRVKHRFHVANLDEMERLAGAFGNAMLWMCRSEESCAIPLQTPFLTVGLIADGGVGKSTFVKGVIGRLHIEPDFRYTKHEEQTEAMRHVASRNILVWANAVSGTEQIQIRSYDRIFTDHMEGRPAFPERIMRGVDFIEHAIESPDLDCLIRIDSMGSSARDVTITMSQSVQDHVAVQTGFLPYVASLEI